MIKHWMVGIAAVAALLSQQDNVGHDQCVICSNEAKCASILKSNQGREQVVRLSNGIAFVAQGKNEENAKAIQEQYKAAVAAWTAKGAKTAPCCVEKLKAVQTATIEVLSSKTGAVILMTAEDQNTIAGLFQFLPETEVKPTGAPTNIAPDSSPTAPKPPKATDKAKLEFIGKGDGKTTCPVAGTAVKADVTTTYMGNTIAFCCGSCKSTFDANPQKFVKVLDM